MPKVAPKDEEVKSADVVEETLATSPKGEVATAVKPDQTVAAISGDFDASDVNYPYLKLYSGQGTYASEIDGKVGDMIISSPLLTSVVANSENPLECIVLSLNKSYRERMAYDANMIPRAFQTRDEYLAEGFTDRDIDNVASMILLIKRPETVVKNSSDSALDIFFQQEFMGSKWCMARCIANGNQYNTIGKPLYTFAMMASDPALALRPFRVKIGCTVEVSKTTGAKYGKFRVNINPNKIDGQVEALQESSMGEFLK